MSILAEFGLQGLLAEQNQIGMPVEGGYYAVEVGFTKLPKHGHL